MTTRRLPLTPMPRQGQVLACAGVLALAWIFGSATLVEKGAAVPAASTNGAMAPAAGVAPATERMARELWDTKLPAYLQGKAVEFNALRVAIEQDPAPAGARHGHRAGADAPWNYVVRIDGTVLRASPGAVVPVLEVDTDGDGRADAIIQCGPIFDGSALRDALDFVSFATFDNQIAYGEFGTALNDLAYAKVTRAACAGAAPGRTLAVTGAFTREGAGRLPLVTPASFTWSAAQ